MTGLILNESTFTRPHVMSPYVHRQSHTVGRKLIYWTLHTLKLTSVL